MVSGAPGTATQGITRGQASPTSQSSLPWRAGRAGPGTVLLEPGQEAPHCLYWPPHAGWPAALPRLSSSNTPPVPSLTGGGQHLPVPASVPGGAPSPEAGPCMPQGHLAF